RALGGPGACGLSRAGGAAAAPAPPFPGASARGAAAWGAVLVPLRFGRFVQRGRPPMELHGLAHALGQLGNESVHFRGREQALAHRASTKTAWISLGPCTPRVSVSSMSAVREGPVMKLMTAPDMLVAGSTWSASSMMPTCSSDSRSCAAPKTATWVA